jgi:Carboxypeptidase regulatory-like domain/TonB dependent receptor
MALDRNARNWLVRLGYITLTCLCLLLIQSPSALAQVDMGSVTGTVSDTSGAVIPNAKVTLLNTDVGLTMEGISDSGGRYTFSPVKIGHYTVTATATGFSKTTQEAITVNVSQTLQVNVQLKPGSATETVTVSTAPPLLQTDQSSVGQVISEQAVNGLPLNGRNFTFLAQLGAGTQTPQADTRGNAASGAFSANGLRPAQNNYLLDGIDNNSNAVDFLNGTNFVVLPPVDAIQEFKVQTATFSAELGRSAGAVLNATIKSGTNSLHGAAWEFFRNNVLDAADWFGNNNGLPKAKLNQNQFGVSAGGPILKNKMFFFGDYEGLQRVQGTTSTGGVPTNLMRSSGYTDFSEILANNAGKPNTDLLNRSIPGGAILDPATTRQVTAGQVDPTSGLVATASGYVRDPFSNGSCGNNYTTGACGLNQLPAGRLDANAINLLNLYPTPTSNGITGNFASSPSLYQHSNSFDTRFDFNPNAKEQIFVRFSYVDNPQYIPGIFGGIADGGSFSQGIQTAKSDQVAAAWTHVFTPTTINVARLGWNHLHTTRFGPEGNNLGLPAQYGIADIPQVPENGGLPTFGIQGLANLGSNNFLPSDEVSQTLQITDDFTKIYGQHNFKMGIEYQHVKFSTLQPAWSRGQYDFNGSFTDIPNNNHNYTGIPQMLLLPEKATVVNGLDYSGGSDDLRASNINKTYDAKNYFATYFQDDWKVSPKLTLNLGLRYDYFGPIQETNGGQANFVPGGPPNGVPTYLIPASGKDNRTLSASFLTLLAKDGIKLESTNQYGQGLLQTQKYNFAPRVGFAYQVSPKFVARGGFGFFYNSFENQGYGPNIGENYPFVYNFEYNVQTPVGAPPGYQGAAPVSFNTPYAGCPTAGPGGTGTFQSGFSCYSLSPEAVNAQGLGLQGLQFDYQTPRTLSANLTMQYSLTNSLSATASYVMTDGSDLQTGVSTNNVSQILPQAASTTNAVPFPDFGHGSSYHATVGRSIYNGLQTKLEQQYAHGLTYLVAYTFSKTLSDAGDLLNGGSVNGYRAPSVPGLGPSFDWALANFDIRNVFHASGSYSLPFGKDQKYMHDAGKLANAVVGGWSANWIYTLQGGQPVTLGCPTGTTAGTNCNDIRVPGQSQKLGMFTSHAVGTAGKPFWFGNPNAFSQPCKLIAQGAAVVPDPSSIPGCDPRAGAGALGNTSSTTTGPGYDQLDLSAFKAFQISERFSMQFRAELFNVLNHPNFNAPGFGGNGVVAIGGSTNYTQNTFGEVGSTRSNSRQIQFALKLYY